MRWATGIPGFAVLAGLVSLQSVVAASGVESGLLTRETRLARLPAGVSQLAISPDASRVAYVLHQGSGSAVTVDGRQGRRYDEVRGVIFSPDSRRLAFAAKSRGKWRVVADRAESRAYDDVSDPRFSPDSRRLMFEAGRGGTIGQSTPWWEVDRKKGRAGRYRLVVNGVESQAYDWIGYWGDLFTDRGVAYWARRGRKHVVVVNGRAGRQYDWIWGPYLSPDGRRIAYAGSQREGADLRFFVVVDGVRSGPYSFLGKQFFAFSPDSKHYAYLAYRGGELLLVADGREQVLGAHSQENFAYVGLSRDGKHLAYSTRSSVGGRWAIVLDGREGKEYDGVALESPRFSPDSRHFAYVALADRESWVVVVDGQEGKHYAGVAAASLVFSPNSSHLACIAGRAGEQFVVVDGAEGSAYDSIVKGSLLYSPDSEHLTYVALRDGRRFVVSDGRVGGGYERIVGPVSSPDSTHIVYGAVTGTRGVVVADGAEMPARYSDFPNARIAFDTTNRFHAVARRGNDLLRVEVEVAPR